jgi:SNF2 family DNA or RNA helicase
MGQRIHRIGQSRTTKVEILITQDTFEEDIAKRASTARTENEEKLYTRALIEVSDVLAVMAKLISAPAICIR